MLIPPSPGPWRVDPSCVGSAVVDAASKYVGHVSHHNAVLAAAAPELRDMLIAILDGGIADPATVARAHELVTRVTQETR